MGVDCPRREEAAVRHSHGRLGRDWVAFSLDDVRLDPLLLVLAGDLVAFWAAHLEAGELGELGRHLGDTGATLGDTG